MVTHARRHRRTSLLSALLALAAIAGLGQLAASADPLTGQDPQASMQQPLDIMRVDAALGELSAPLQDITVTNPDSGVDVDNPDLSGRLWSNPMSQPAPYDAYYGEQQLTMPVGAHGWNMYGDAADGCCQDNGDISDPYGHGTLVTGVAAAERGNGVDGRGIAPNARIFALKGCVEDPQPDYCDYNTISYGLDWAIAHAGVRVVSMSWTANGVDSSNERLVQTIEDNPDVLFVTIPSGNVGPGEAPEETQPGDQRLCDMATGTYSNGDEFSDGTKLTQAYGNIACVTTSSPSDGLDCGNTGPQVVQVAVPTENNITTDNAGNSDGTGCATSFASPTFAGAATVLFGMDPSATAKDVRDTLLSTARKVSAWAGNSTTGGVVDLAAAVTAFQKEHGITPADATHPSPYAPDLGTSTMPTPTPTPSTTAGATPSPTPTPSPTSTPDHLVRTASLSLGRGTVKARHGTSVSLPVTLTLADRVAVTVTRTTPGRRNGKTCLPSAGRVAAAKRCTAVVAVATAQPVQTIAGRHLVAVPVKDAHHHYLPRGTYAVVVRLLDTRGHTVATSSEALKLS